MKITQMDYRELNKNKLRNTHTKEFQSFPKNEILLLTQKFVQIITE